jgi:hypothetical protein
MLLLLQVGWQGRPCPAARGAKVRRQCRRWPRQLPMGMRHAYYLPRLLLLLVVLVHHMQRL